MRIVSLLPSATEIVHAIGAGDSLVGVTHECDFPPGVERLPHVTANLLPGDLSSAAIDDAVSASMKQDEHTIYSLDDDLLRGLAPDVIMAQQLCDVCAVPTALVEDAVCTMPRGAQIVSLDPLCLDDVFACVEQAGDVLGIPGEARRVAASLRGQVDDVRRRVALAARPRVLAVEWLDPIWCGGHWVPEMIDAAGGVDPFGVAGERSRRIEWDTVAAADPDVIVLMPCGFDAREVVERYHEITAAPEWSRLRAVCLGGVYAVDATSYFSRPGPRLADGVRIVGRILHPDLVTEPLADGVAFKLSASDFAPYI